MTTFKRVTTTETDRELGTYNVIAEGVIIGQVWKAWYRLGGHGWTHDLVVGQGFATRLDAARSLHRLYLRRHAPVADAR